MAQQRKRPVAAPKPPSRQSLHREALEKDGGRYVTVELGPLAVVHLEHIRQRDTPPEQVKPITTRAVIEASLELNAKRKR